MSENDVKKKEAPGATTRRTRTRRKKGGEGGEEVDEEVSEEAQKPSIVCKPCRPTKEEVEEHMCNGHNPFRNWCPFCVKGASNAKGHYTKPEDDENAVPVISMDYMYMNSKKTLEGERRRHLRSAPAAPSAG